MSNFLPKKISSIRICFLKEATVTNVENCQFILSQITNLRFFNSNNLNVFSEIKMNWATPGFAITVFIKNCKIAKFGTCFSRNLYRQMSVSCIKYVKTYTIPINHNHVNLCDKYTINHLYF